MGVFKDIVDIIKSEEVLDEIKQNALTKKYSSLAARASEGTMQFPTLVSDSMDIDTLQMISKALERNYSTFLQTVLTMNSIQNTSKYSDTTDFLKQFHQNSSKVTTNDITRNIVKVMDSYSMDELINGKVVMCETYNSATNLCVIDNRKQLVDLMESLRKDILNDKFIPNNRAAVYMFRNREVAAKYNMVTEAKGKNRGPDPDLQNKKLKKENNPDTVFDKDMNLQLQNDKLNQLKTNTELTKVQAKKMAYDTNQYTTPQSILKDNDVKKANELIATTLHVRLHLVNKDGDAQGVKDFILGVKSIMHLVKAEEMIENMVAACKNNNTVFNFLRWTTGEISFFKDFWLNINEMKRTVANESKGASRWWNALKKRRSLGKASSTALVKNKIMPNATIVISAEEAEIIKSYYGYDVRNPYFLQKIMDSYYLLGFVIVDVGSQVAHFYFDGDEDFQSVSFGGLEKENSRDERKFKEMLKTINRT